MEFKICRVCLDRTATISMFNKQDEVQYCTKIMKCVNILIAEGDGFPDAICEGCAGDLAVSYEFATRCEASDRALRCLDLLHSTEPELEPKTQPELVKDEVEPELDASSEQHDTEEHENNFYEPLYEYCKKEFENESPEVLSNENNTIKCVLKHSKRILPEHLRIRKLRLKTGPIQCAVCNRTLSCHSAYELHMRTHTKERPYSCDICKKTFANKYTMKKHIQRHYGVIDEHNKNKNGKASDKRRNRPKTGPFQCTTCGNMVKSHSAMENHMRTHTGEKPFACELCGAKYRLKGTLKRHMHCSHPETHPSTKYTCEHCGKVFLSKNNIVTHMRVHTGDRPYLCTFCPKRFRQVSSLIRHRRGHTGERPYVCNICNRPFHDKTLLNKHQSVHSSERKFSCHICNKSFKTKSTLKVHTDGHSKTKLWICSFCGMTFTFKGNLKIHIERKHSERAGTCSICKKEFSDLEAHMRMHTGEKPFKCKICDQSYASSRSLSQHMGFKHRNADKFKCALEDCSKSFPTASMLEFHVLKQHTQTAPYACRHCARGFLRPCDLSRHLKLNHMDTQTQVKSHFLKAILKDT